LAKRDLHFGKLRAHEIAADIRRVDRKVAKTLPIDGQGETLGVDSFYRVFRNANEHRKLISILLGTWDDLSEVSVWQRPSTFKKGLGGREVPSEASNYTFN
jgi:hypothetical protein